MAKLALNLRVMKIKSLQSDNARILSCKLQHEKNSVTWLLYLLNETTVKSHVTVQSRHIPESSVADRTLNRFRFAKENFVIYRLRFALYYSET